MGENNIEVEPEWKKGSAEPLVLSLLEAQSRHGYDVSHLIKLRSGRAVGFLYAILDYAATRRQREIDLRMALGASRISVLRLLLGQALSFVLAGLAIGFTMSVATGRILGRTVFGVSSTDPLSIGAAAIVLIAVALVACYLPAWWASRVDPLTALREI